MKGAKGMKSDKKPQGDETFKEVLEQEQRIDGLLFTNDQASGINLTKLVKQLKENELYIEAIQVNRLWARLRLTAAYNLGLLIEKIKEKESGLDLDSLIF